MTMGSAIGWAVISEGVVEGAIALFNEERRNKD
jgi:hypothetical protein